MTRYDAEYWDHQRDLAKHDWRPGDRMTTAIDAIEIAALVKGMNSITEAAKLIDQYAATVAAGAKLEGVQQVYERIDTLLPKVSA